MIERIVLLKLREDLATPTGRRAIAEELSAELATNAGAWQAELGLPADPASERSWDLMLRFRREAIPDENVPGPEAALISALGERLLVHKAWSFERCA